MEDVVGDSLRLLDDVDDSLLVFKGMLVTDVTVDEVCVEGDVVEVVAGFVDERDVVGLGEVLVVGLEIAEVAVDDIELDVDGDLEVDGDDGTLDEVVEVSETIVDDGAVSADEGVSSA